MAIQVPALLDDCFLLSFEAQGYQQLQRWERLIPGRSLRVVYEMQTETGGTEHNLGVKALESGDLVGAEQHFLRALEIQPSLALSHHALAELYLHQKRYLEAIDSAKAALAGKPGDGRSLEILYSANHALERDSQAQEALLALVDGGHAALAGNHYHQEGLVALAGGETDLALGKFREAVSLLPDLVVAHISLAEAAIQAGRPAEAAEATIKALTVEPSSLRAMRLSLTAHSLSGQWEQVNFLLETLVADDPDLADVILYRRAIELMGPDEAQTARSLFDRLIDFAPDHARARYFLGLLATRTGETEEARVYLSRYLELAPADAEAENARSLIAKL